MLGQAAHRFAAGIETGDDLPEDIDHLLVIAQYFGALPKDVVVLEIEPVDARGGQGLSPQTLELLTELTKLVREELGVSA